MTENRTPRPPIHAAQIAALRQIVGRMKPGEYSYSGGFVVSRGGSEIVCQPETAADTDIAALLPCPFCGCDMHMGFDPKHQYYGPEGQHAGQAAGGTDR